MNGFGNLRTLGVTVALVLGACSASSNAGNAGQNTQSPAVGGPGQLAGMSGAGHAAGIGGVGASTAPVSSAGAGGRSGIPAALVGTAGGAAATAGRGGMAGGAAGAPGAPGAAGTMAPKPGADPSACPAAPAGSSDAAIAALAAVNALRAPAGSGCANMVLTLNMSALNHCNYYAMNSQTQMCIANPHNEVMSGCTGFTGTGPGQRMMAAGYTGRGGGGEVMAFVNNPMQSIATWVNSVWHRVPTLDPWTTDLGYGNAARCDTIDFGRGTSVAPADTIVVYPYNGQTGVPTNFNGAQEGPMPPAPASGWPSSSPINIYAQKISVTEHVLTLDGDSNPIAHVWLDSTSTNVDMGVLGTLASTNFMYANTPFTANTKYRVKIAGTHTGGAFNLEWTFTTGAVNRF